MKSRILLVDHNEDVLTILRQRLATEGYTVDCARDGLAALDKALSSPFDLIVLEVTLPEWDGFDVCYDIRRADLTIPILFLTARSRATDKQIGIRLGGDDYLIKPVEMKELLARIEELIKRDSLRASSFRPFGTIRIDVRGNQVKRKERTIELQARESQLLRFFVENVGEILTRGAILKNVWGDKVKYTHILEVFVSRLRRKLEENPKDPRIIETVPGVGYRLRAEFSDMFCSHHPAPENMVPVASGAESKPSRSRERLGADGELMPAVWSQRPNVRSLQAKGRQHGTSAGPVGVKRAAVCYCEGPTR